MWGLDNRTALAVGQFFHCLQTNVGLATLAATLQQQLTLPQLRQPALVEVSRRGRARAAAPLPRGPAPEPLLPIAMYAPGTWTAVHADTPVPTGDGDQQAAKREPRILPATPQPDPRGW